MILKAYSIYDIKGEVFSVPFFKNAHGQAVRDFKMLVNDKNSTPGRFPEDYKLVYVGEFDDATGVFVSRDGATSLGFGSDYVDKPSDSVVPLVKKGA